MTSTALQDIDILARTLWGEARGEGSLGMEAVANVILNRSKDPRWPSRIADVCLQPRQFSCWNKSDPNLKILEIVDLNDKAFRQAYAIAATAFADMLGTDLTQGANHYLTSSLFWGPSCPHWADKDRMTCGIGNHVFLKL